VTLNFAPNISWIFKELDFKDRARAAARLGFKAVEFGFPSACDIDGLDEVRQELGLMVVLFNQDVPVWEPGNRGYLADPARRAEFHRKLDEALEVARKLSAQKVMLPAGVELPGMPRAEQRACMVENLAYAGRLGVQAGVLFTAEVLNPIDNPGYFLTTSKEALEIVKEVNHPQVKMQFDTYHIQLMEGGEDQQVLESILQENMPSIGHIQFADVPGRHEPGTGKLNFARLLSLIEKAGYQGTIGLEYKPQAQSGAALDWVRSLR
jgi:hydroxypyruvate isomerase